MINEKSAVLQNHDKKIKDLVLKKEERNKWIMGKFTILFKLLPTITVNLVALFIIGLDKFVDGEWDFTIFGNADFWYSYFNFQLALWLIIINILIQEMKKLKDSVLEYTIYTDKIQDYVDIDHEEPFIEDESKKEDMRRKKLTLEYLVYNKLEKILKRYKLGTLSDFEKKLKESTNTKMYKKYKKIDTKVQGLLIMTTQEWQRDYLKSYKMVYVSVSRQLLVSGFNVSKNNELSFNDYKSYQVSTFMLDYMPSTIITSIVALGILSFRPLMAQFNIISLLTLLIQILIIAWNGIMIKGYAPTHFFKTILNPLEQRRCDLGLFKDRHDKGKPTIHKMTSEEQERFNKRIQENQYVPTPNIVKNTKELAEEDDGIYIETREKKEEENV